MTSSSAGHLDRAAGVDVVGTATAAGVAAASAGSGAALAHGIAQTLGSYIHRGQCEAQIQDSVASVLFVAGYEVAREHRLSERDRPDFFVNGHVVVEVKMRASGGAVLWQLGRYAQHGGVRAIVVASPRFTSLSALPTSIHRVPVVGVGLRGAGLML
jgi:hypothetical protein